MARRTSASGAGHGIQVIAAKIATSAGCDVVSPKARPTIPSRRCARRARRLSCQHQPASAQALDRGLLKPKEVDHRAGAVGVEWPAKVFAGRIRQEAALRAARCVVVHDGEARDPAAWRLGQQMRTMRASVASKSTIRLCGGNEMIHRDDALRTREKSAMSLTNTPTTLPRVPCLASPRVTPHAACGDPPKRRTRPLLAGAAGSALQATSCRQAEDVTRAKDEGLSVPARLGWRSMPTCRAMPAAWRGRRAPIRWGQLAAGRAERLEIARIAHHRRHWIIYESGQSADARGFVESVMR